MAKQKTQQKPRDAEATRNAILNAAETEFARAGLLGARTENIAANSGVTRAMIHYYYDSKEKLYQSVLERAVAARVRANQHIDMHADHVEEALVEYITMLVMDVLQHPNLPTILVHEAIQNEGKYYREVSFAVIYEPLIRLLCRGVEKGYFRQMEPVHCAINLIGMSVYYFCVRSNVRYLFPPETDMLGEETVRTHLKESIELILTGLRKPR